MTAPPATDWIAAADIAACAGTASADAIQLAVSTASEVLRALAGGRFGPQTIATLRPNRLVAGCGCTPHLWPSGDGWWLDQGGAAGVILPPRSTVSAVKVDGVTLDPALYTVYDQSRLVRSPDPVSGVMLLWPCCQRMDLPDTEKGTWSVTVAAGEGVTAGAKSAAQAFACHLLPLIPGGNSGGACDLPDNVQSLTRQGVQVNMIDPSAFLDHGRTGVKLVDVWLGAVNPGGARSRAVFASPDTIILSRRSQ